MALAIQRVPLAKGRILSTLVMAFALMLQPMYGLVVGQVANAVALDPFPSTNQLNKDNNRPYVEQTGGTYNTVTLKFANPTNSDVWFEVRADGAAQTGTSQWGVCTAEANPLPSGCDGLRYLEHGEASWPSKKVVRGATAVQTYNVSNNVSVRMTFGPERNWDFNWVSFAVADGVCTYDFPAQKMWEINWGRQLADKNAAQTFTMQSHGGLVSLNDGPIPSDMTSSWHWVYPVEGQNRDFKYGFADGTVRTAKVRFTVVNGCQEPVIEWGLQANQAPVFTVDPSTRYAKKLADLRFIITDETGVSKSQVNIRNESGEGVEKYIRPNGANNAIPLVHVSGDIWKLNLTGMNDNLPDGDYEFRARSTDSTGLVGYSAWRTATLDNVGPLVSVDSPASSSSVSGMQKFVINASDLSGMTKVHMYLQQDGFTRTFNMTDLGNGQWEYTVDTTGLNGDGEYFVVVRAMDALGNVRYHNNRHNGHFVVVDNTAPGAPSITTPVDGQEFTATPGGDVIRSEWTAVADAVEYEIKYEYTRNSSRVTDTRKTTNTYRDQGLSGNVLSDFVIQVRAKDAAGNWSAWSDAVTYYYGVDAPAQGGDEEDDDDEVVVVIPGDDTGTPTGPNNGTDGESLPENEDEEPVQLFTAPFGFAFQPFTNDTNEGDDEVVTENNDDNGDVAGVQDQEAGTPLEDTGEVLSLMDHKWFGIAWYWFLVILGGLIGAWLMLASAIRRHRGEEA